MVELILPTVTKVANLQRTVISLGNPVFIMVIIVVDLDRDVGESNFHKELQTRLDSKISFYVHTCTEYFRTRDI